MGGKPWVFVVISKWVESDHGLGDESIPLFGGKVRVSRSNSGAKVIFECADRTLCGVTAVGVHRDKLEVTIVFVEGFLHGVEVFFVKDVESGDCIMLAYMFVACFRVVVISRYFRFLRRWVWMELV